MKNGDLNDSFDDLYIPCASKCYIMHHEYNTLVAIIPSMTKGNNIIKDIYEERFGENTSYGIAYEELYKEVIKLGNIVKIEPCDLINKKGKNIGEMLIYFKNDYMSTMAKYLKPQTNGANTIPFSVKNLPKSKYEIPEEDLIEYKNIASKFKKSLDVGHLTKQFCKDFDKADMKLKGLKGKEYIHSIGKWDEYLNYLKMRIR